MKEAAQMRVVDPMENRGDKTLNEKSVQAISRMFLEIRNSANFSLFQKESFD